MIIRMFDTAVDPGDVERGQELFREKVRPAFGSFDGCHGIDMYVGVEPSAGVVDVVALSRWTSEEQIARALATEEYAEALAELKELFQRAPIVRHFQATD